MIKRCHAGILGYLTSILLVECDTISTDLFSAYSSLNAATMHGKSLEMSGSKNSFPESPKVSASTTAGSMDAKSR
jgi:hypothetical protein